MYLIEIPFLYLGESETVYKDHILKTEDGKVLCPVRNICNVSKWYKI